MIKANCIKFFSFLSFLVRGVLLSVRFKYLRVDYIQLKDEFHYENSYAEVNWQIKNLIILKVNGKKVSKNYRGSFTVPLGSGHESIRIQAIGAWFKRYKKDFEIPVLPRLSFGPLKVEVENNLKALTNDFLYRYVGEPAYTPLKFKLKHFMVSLPAQAKLSYSQPSIYFNQSNPAYELSVLSDTAS